MNRSWKVEGTAGLMVFMTVFALPIGIFAYQFGYRPAQTPSEVIVVGKMVERGGWSPEEIVVKKGQRVRLVVSSHDVTHGLAIPAFRVDTGAVTGGSSRIVEFVADREGRFRFRCTVICSLEHGDMEGEVVVEP